MIKQIMFVGALFSLCSISSAYAMGNPGIAGKTENYVTSLRNALCYGEDTHEVQKILNEYWNDRLLNKNVTDKTKLVNDLQILSCAEAAVYLRKVTVKAYLKKAIKNSADITPYVYDYEPLQKMYGNAIANHKLVEWRLKNNNS